MDYHYWALKFKVALSRRELIGAFTNRVVQFNIIV